MGEMAEGKQQDTELLSKPILMLLSGYRNPMNCSGSNNLQIGLFNLS